MRDLSFNFLFRFLFEKALFGRSLAQLILAALSLYPFGVKDGQKQRFLSDAPFGRFSESLARRLPLQAAHVFGAYSRSTLSELRQAWAEFLLTQTLGARMWPSGFDLGPPKLESCLRWPPALRSELLLLPGALCVLLYGGGLSAYQPLYPFRPTSHKYGFLSRAPSRIQQRNPSRQQQTTNKQTNEQTN